MAPPVPVPLGRYVLHKELASGGMASVFFARMVGPSGFARTVAVKRPHEHLVSDRAFVMMLIDEARLASRINHPNVVSTLDVVETPSAMALVMEYVHGESLARLWAAAQRRGESIALPIAAQILIDALHGLHAAHEAADEQGRPLGIVHRDVSPQNLIVGADGITRIADFGIAKAAGRMQTTRDGAVKGKYAYMAPEQIRGATVTRQTDVFAASIILWELLTGEWLFRAGTEAEEIYKCLQGEVEAPSARNRSVPPEFDAIVLRGLAREPSERYATAREMAADLERAAPAVRASEIGAWVVSLAGDVLASRSQVIAEMERSGLDSGAAIPMGARARGAEGVGEGPGGDDPGAGAPRDLGRDAARDDPRPGRGPEREGGGPERDVALARSQPESRDVPRVGEPQSHAGVVTERTPPPVAPRGAGFGRRWPVIAIAAFCVGFAGYATLSLRGGARSHAGAADGPSSSLSGGPAPFASQPSAVAAAQESSAAAQPSASAVPSAAALDPAAATPGASAAPGPNVAPRPAPSTGKPENRGAPKKPQSTSCQPPYYIDAQGREVFKVQCL